MDVSIINNEPRWYIYILIEGVGVRGHRCRRPAGLRARPLRFRVSPETSPGIRVARLYIHACAIYVPRERSPSKVRGVKRYTSMYMYIHTHTHIHTYVLYACICPGGRGTLLFITSVPYTARYHFVFVVIIIIIFYYFMVAGV